MSAGNTAPSGPGPYYPYWPTIQPQVPAQAPAYNYYTSHCHQCVVVRPNDYIPESESDDD